MVREHGLISLKQVEGRKVLLASSVNTLTTRPLQARVWSPFAACVCVHPYFSSSFTASALNTNLFQTGSEEKVWLALVC